MKTYKVHGSKTYIHERGIFFSCILYMISLQKFIIWNILFALDCLWLCFFFLPRLLISWVFIFEWKLVAPMSDITLCGICSQVDLSRVVKSSVHSLCLTTKIWVLILSSAHIELHIHLMRTSLGSKWICINGQKKVLVLTSKCNTVDEPCIKSTIEHWYKTSESS